MKPTIYDCSVINIDKINHNRSGNLTVVTNGDTLPFDVKRIFYLYDVPAGEDRGGHSHIQCHQLLIAASGSFSVEVTDGKIKKVYNLNRPSLALHIPPGIWASEFDFSGGSICLVLASHTYDAADYIRCLDEYKKIREDGLLGKN